MLAASFALLQAHIIFLGESETDTYILACYVFFHFQLYVPLFLSNITPP